MGKNRRRSTECFRRSGGHIGTQIVTVKVLQVNKLYYPWIGGVEKVVQDLAEHLRDKTTMSVLVSQPRGPGICECINKVRVYRAGSIGIYLSMPVSLSFPFLLKRLSRDKDILHFHLPFPLGVIAYLLVRPKSKLVVWWHSDIVRQKSILRFYKPLLFRFLKASDKIIVATAKHIENSSFLKRYRDKCEIVPFGVDMKRFQPNDSMRREAAKIRAEYNAKIVLFAGRLTYYKGVEYLIKAMKYVDAKLLVIGRGYLEKKLRQLVSEHRMEDKIVFLGEVEDERMPAYYHSCDVFVLPSIAASEAFGIVQLEAMACGKTVVNTNLPSGVPCISVDGQTGITVPPAEANSLANAINTLLTNTKLREKYGRNALMRVEKYFRVEGMANKTYEIYQNILNQP